MSEDRIKIYEASDIKCDEGKREVVSIINTSAIDRDGEVVQPKGLKKKNFQGNPVVFANHAYMSDPKTLPCGRCLWLKYGQDANGEDVLIAKTQFSDKTQDGRDVFALFQDKIMNAFSIGFRALRQSKPSTAEINARPDLKMCKNIVREWEMLEYSAVAIPANQECLALAVSKGYSKRVIDMLSGKAAATEKATAEIIEAVENEPAIIEHKISQKEMKRLIANRIDSITLDVDCDAIASSVIARLFKD